MEPRVEFLLAQQAQASATAAIVRAQIAAQILAYNVYFPSNGEGPNGPESDEQCRRCVKHAVVLADMLLAVLAGRDEDDRPAVPTY